MAVQPIPEGYRTVTPYLVVDGAASVLEFMKTAFGARERFRMDAPNGAVAHAEAEIGDSLVMLGDVAASEAGEAMPAMIHLYVEDADKVYAAALEAGATSMQEPTNQFYGDRSGGVKDRAGNVWWISTHVEDVPPDELAKRAEEWQSKQ